MVLLELGNGLWRGAVIESRPLRPFFTFCEPSAATLAGVDLGSGIQLPIAEIPPDRVGYLKGTVAGITLARIESALAEALEPLSAVENRSADEGEPLDGA